jgi:hypothetical protein
MDKLLLTIGVGSMSYVSAWSLALQNAARARQNSLDIEDMIERYRTYEALHPKGYTKRSYSLQIKAMEQDNVKQLAYIERPWYGRVFNMPPYPRYTEYEKYAYENNYHDETPMKYRRRL